MRADTAARASAFSAAMRALRAMLSGPAPLALLPVALAHRGSQVAAVHGHRVPSTSPRTRGKSAAFRLVANLEPLSRPLQAGIRFLPLPLPAAPSLTLAGSVPTFRWERYGFTKFRRVHLVSCRLRGRLWTGGGDVRPPPRIPRHGGRSPIRAGQPAFRPFQITTLRPTITSVPHSGTALTASLRCGFGAYPHCRRGSTPRRCQRRTPD